MPLDTHDILEILPRNPRVGGHLNCQQCNCQSCVAFALKITKGTVQLSECPFINDDSKRRLERDSILQTQDTDYSVASDAPQGKPDSIAVIPNDIRPKSKERRKGRREKQSDMTENSITTIHISNNNLFNTQKDALKSFSAQLPKETNLPTVPIDGGLFGLFNHNVTGEELNSLTENIQTRMIEQNKTLVKIIQEFSTIYDTFSSLDKIYVQEILITLNAAVKAGEKANESLIKLTEQQNEIKDNQQDIKQLVDQQKQIIQVLKNFKEKLEDLKHLNDVDKIYNNSLNIQAKIDALEKAIKKQTSKVGKLADEQEECAKILENIKDSNCELDKKISDSVCALEDLSSKLCMAIEQSENDHANTAREIGDIKGSNCELNRRITDLTCVLEALSSKLHTAIEQSENGLACVVGEIKDVKDTQKCFEESLDAQRKNIESLYSIQKEYDISLSRATTEIECFTKETNCKHEIVQNDLITLRNENAALIKSLIVTRGISIISFISAATFIILSLTGVLR